MIKIRRAPKRQDNNIDFKPIITKIFHITTAIYCYGSQRI